LPSTTYADAPSIETTNEPASNVFDSMSSSVIKLTGGRALYLKEVNRHLALICVLREEALSKQAIIDYNVRQIKESILKLIQLDRQHGLQSSTVSHIIR
jgi:Ras-related GTP-binding protein C/D